MSIETRPARQADEDSIFRILCAAFNVEEGTPKWFENQRFVRASVSAFRVITCDGEIIGALTIRRHVVQVGCAELMKGDVGHVCIRPDAQGKGLGTTMMRDGVEWMRANGFDLSRLGGYMDFYRRFGYVPLPRRYVRFPITPVKAGAIVFDARDVYPETEDTASNVIPYDPQIHAAGVGGLLQTFNEKRTGSAGAGSAPSGETPKDDLRYVYLTDGRVSGYISAAEADPPITRPVREMSISDFAFESGVPEAAGALLKTVLREADARELDGVTSRIPFDHAVVEAMCSEGVKFELVESHQALAGNMIQVIDLSSLLDKLAPELERRLARSVFPRWSGTLDVALENDQRGALHFSGGAPAGDVVKLPLDQRTFVMLVLGLRAFHETGLGEKLDIPATECAVLDALFPRQPAFSGNWG